MHFSIPPVNKIGRLIDISLSGLAFNYFSKDGASHVSNRLDLLGGGEIYLEDVSYKTVDDFILPNEQPFSQINIRRRCIMFGSLTDEHKKSIQELIDKYGQMEAG